jgi:hypothetical protein
MTASTSTGGTDVAVASLAQLPPEVFESLL